MNYLLGLLDEGWGVQLHRPVRRALVHEGTWMHATALLAAGELTLLSIWGDGSQVHMALLDAEDQHRIGVLTLQCPEGYYPSVGGTHPPAIRLEDHGTSNGQQAVLCSINAHRRFIGIAVFKTIQPRAEDADDAGARPQP